MTVCLENEEEDIVLVTTKKKKLLKILSSYILFKLTVTTKKFAGLSWFPSFPSKVNELKSRSVF